GERQGRRFINSASDSPGKHVRRRHPEFAQRKQRIRQRFLSGRGRENEVAIERGVNRIDRAGQTGLRHDGKAFGLALAEFGIGGNDGEGGIFTRGPFAAKLQRRRRDRGWPPKPTKFLALFKRRRPKMWSVPDGHAAGGICSGKRSHRNAAARPSAGGTDAALQIDGRGAETGAAPATRQVMACRSRRFLAELSIGRIAPPIL